MFKLSNLWPYIVFCLSLAGLLAANKASMQKESSKTLNHARIIYYAGRQRMLSQKITKLCYQRALGKDTREEIMANLVIWNQAHTALQKGSDSLHLLAQYLPSTLRLLIHIDPIQRQLAGLFTTAATQIPDKTLLHTIETNEDAFLDQMSTVITVIENNTVKQIQHAEQKQDLLGLLSGAILLLEIVVFVYPFHKRLVEAYKGLKLQRAKSEIQQQQIEELNTSNELTIAGISAGVWDWNIATGDERWSHSLYQLLGYEPGDLPATYNSFIYRLLHPEERDKTKEAVLAHLDNRVPYRIEVRLLHKDGKYRWCEVSGQAQWNEAGVAIRMAGSIIDVDDSVHYREQIEYNEFLLEEAGNIARMGGWEYDVATREAYWTKTMYDILEVSRNDTKLAVNRLDSYLPQYHSQISMALKRAFTVGEPFDIELQLVTKKGATRWIRSIGIPVYDNQKKVTRLRGVYQDINRHKLRELELIDTRGKLDASNHDKDKLFSIIAHDLRGPIVNLKGLIELLQKEQIDKEQFLHYTTDVNISISFLAETMDNLLHWAQSQLQGFTVTPQTININTAIQQTTDLYAKSMAYKNIKLINNNTIDFFAYADLNHVLLILRNLLNNAIKFTPGGGIITIVISETSDTVAICIEDTGIGMSEEELEKIIKHLSINSRRGTNGEKGTGLGLGLCYEIAEKNGGAILVNSKKEEGTTFTLILPKITEH